MDNILIIHCCIMDNIICPLGAQTSQGLGPFPRTYSLTTDSKGLTPSPRPSVVYKAVAGLGELSDTKCPHPATALYTTPSPSVLIRHARWRCPGPWVSWALAHAGFSATSGPGPELPFKPRACFRSTEPESGRYRLRATPRCRRRCRGRASSPSAARSTLVADKWGQRQWGRCKSKEF